MSLEQSELDKLEQYIPNLQSFSSILLALLVSLDSVSLLNIFTTSSVIWKDIHLMC